MHPAIPVRTSGPKYDHAGAADVLAETFRRLFTHCREISSYPQESGPNGFFTTGAEIHARTYGLCIQLATMVRCTDPRIPCSQETAWQLEGAEAVFHLITGQWSKRLKRLAKDEDNDKTWELFFRAVAAAETHERVADLTEELAALAPKSHRYCNWNQRIRYYTEYVLPEYRRWFTHVLDPSDVALPRI